MATGSTPPSLPKRILRKGFRPLYPLYYRYLWGRTFPGHVALRRWVRAWEDLSTRGDAPQSAEAWDQQYRQGEWDLLQDTAEIPRYERLVELWRRHAGAGSLLDIGAGDAVLRPYLPTAARYLGVDLSAAAVERGQSRLQPGDRLLAADAERWQPDEALDAIVLNECVYYFEDPIETVERFRGELAAEGVLIVSMFETPRSQAIRRRLLEVLPALEQTVVPADRGGRWWMGVFAARGVSSGEVSRIEAVDRGAAGGTATATVSASR